MNTESIIDSMAVIAAFMAGSIHPQIKSIPEDDYDPEFDLYNEDEDQDSQIVIQQARPPMVIYLLWLLVVLILGSIALTFLAIAFCFTVFGTVIIAISQSKQSKKGITK